MKKIISMSLFLICLVGCFQRTYAKEYQNMQLQEKKVSGVIVDIDGLPIPGANVMIKDTHVGVASDIDGNYTITLPNQNSILVFTFIGYQTQEIPYNGQKVLNIVMREATEVLDDVVIVGYGSQRKESITAALSSVPMETLISVPTANFSNSIGGHLPGLITRQTSGEPGFDGAQIYIRGLSTWTGTTSPLILVDGVERDINLVNPHEVENFTILKDASATAVYGVKGANGVILITTKKGIKGKPQVQFRTEAAVLTGMRFPQYIDGWEFANLMNEANRNIYRSEPWTEEDIRLFKDHSSPYTHPNVNWTDEVYKKNTNQTINNLSITGGNETVRYYIAAGHTGQSGLFKEDSNLDYRTNSRLNRFNFRSNVDVNIHKDFVVDLGLGAIVQSRNYQGTAAGEIHNATKIITPISYPKVNPDGSIGGGPGYMANNPWALATQSGYTNMYINTIQGTFGAKWDLSSLITPGLSLTGKFAFDSYAFTEIFRTISYGVKQYLGPDIATGEDRYSIIREPGTMGSRTSNAGSRSYYWDVTANYARSFNEHRVAALLLFNRNEDINIQASNEIENIPRRRQGLAGRFSYDYGNRYFTEFNFGWNGSENFPPGKRYGFFPSISVGWVPTSEAFWTTNSVVSHLKLRASHGQVGNDQIGSARFLYKTFIDKGAPGYHWGTTHSGYGGLGEGQIGVENITWETSTKSNVGLDMNFFNDLLNLQIDAFHEIRSNILLTRQTVPDYIGITSVPSGNLGKVKNRGVDGMLELRKQTSSGFFYSFRSNFSFARNEILEDDMPKPLWDYQSTKGQRINQPFGLVALGFFRDEEDIANSPQQMFQDMLRPGDIKYKDINEDGVIDQYDRVPIGYGATPEIMFGFGGTVAYKGFDFTAYFTGVGNRSTFLVGAGMWPFELEYPNYNIFREYYDYRFIPENIDNRRAKYPAVNPGRNPNNYQTSTLYMRNATYLRFQNAEVGYTLPRTLTDKLKIRKVRIFANGNNLYVWDNIKIVDPEMNDTGAYPMQRTINFGAQIDF